MVNKGVSGAAASASASTNMYSSEDLRNLFTLQPEAFSDTYESMVKGAPDQVWLSTASEPQDRAITRVISTE